MLLQIGQLLSNVGTQTTSIAFPLLVLAVTHSPAKAGIVGFARSLPWVLFALPAGLAADRWSRRRLMILADGVRVLAIGTLAVTILLDRVAFWEVVIVAFVEGIGSALFFGAQPGALRAVVPAPQLPAAAAAETGRQAVVRLAGPPLEWASTDDIISDATPLGSIQVPSSGLPILLMSDRATTGGYPKIGTVIGADIPVAGQLAPGDWVEFSVCDRGEALIALRAQEAALRGKGE